LQKYFPCCTDVAFSLGARGDFCVDSPIWRILKWILKRSAMMRA
jgi:hypothetical protein